MRGISGWICGEKWVYGGKNEFKTLKTRREMAKNGQKMGDFSRFFTLFKISAHFLHTLLTFFYTFLPLSFKTKQFVNCLLTYKYWP